jgi:hypothetical protein
MSWPLRDRGLAAAGIDHELHASLACFPPHAREDRPRQIHLSGCELAGQWAIRGGLEQLRESMNWVPVLATVASILASTASVVIAATR